MSFPREESWDEVIGDRQYYDGIRWRIFEDPTGELKGRQVLVLLGDGWTLLDGAAFRTLAERILKQL